jgi:hypothetical protein
LADENKIDSIKDALIYLSGAVIATRETMALLASQPTLLFSQTDRERIAKSFEDGTNHLNKALAAIDALIHGM